MLSLLVAFLYMSLLITREGYSVYSAISHTSYYLMYWYILVTIIVIFIPTIHKLIQVNDIFFMSMSYLKQVFVILTGLVEATACNLIYSAVPITTTTATFGQVNKEYFILGLFMFTFALFSSTKWPYDIIWLKEQMIMVPGLLKVQGKS